MGVFDNFKTLVGINTTKQPSASPSQIAASTKKVLIVEDEQMLADALALKLRNEGFTVFTAVNGQLGLDSIKENKPDLVLLDLMMPVMNGKTLLHDLREIPEFKQLPVFILTNAGDADNMRETQLYYNAEEFFIKSNVNPDEIVQKVKQKLLIIGPASNIPPVQ